MLAHTCITYFTYCLQITINILNTLALYAFLRDIRTWTYHHELRIVQHVRPRRDNVVLYADFNWYCLGFLFLNWTSSCEFPLKCNCHNSSCHSSEVRYEVFHPCSTSRYVAQAYRMRVVSPLSGFILSCPGLLFMSHLAPVRLHYILVRPAAYKLSHPRPPHMVCCSVLMDTARSCCADTGLRYIRYPRCKNSRSKSIVNLSYSFIIYGSTNIS